MSNVKRITRINCEYLKLNFYYIYYFLERFYGCLWFHNQGNSTHPKITKGKNMFRQKPQKCARGTYVNKVKTTNFCVESIIFLNFFLI